MHDARLQRGRRKDRGQGLAEALQAVGDRDQDVNTPRDPLEASFEKFTFGNTGDEESLLGCTVAAVDYNKDGWDDLRCEFVFGDTGLALGDTAAVLKGKLGKITIIGTDSIDVRLQDEEEDEADEDD
jgi:hypothetical protein